MKLASVHSRAQLGIDAPEVLVEVHISNGLPALTIVGLPEAAVRESKDRVRAAIINSQFEFPARKITVNLAPAELPKSGGRYDLPIAIGILAASDQLDHSILDNRIFIGELGLSGELRSISGCLPSALSARAKDMALVCPVADLAEASMVEDVTVCAAGHLLEVCNQHFTSRSEHSQATVRQSTLDMSDVRGQHRARRALEVAAAGRHNLLMVGPPGTGKSMLASRLPGIMPEMDENQALQTASIYSISHHGLDASRWRTRPFRAPHHTASGVALVGGGSSPAPGEISLAHNGVLFLDELTEFDRRVLDVLREPLETGRICISRAARQAEFPANFQLIAAMNPCPQGYHCDGRALCECTIEQQKRHRARISAPLLDRIDIHIEVPQLQQSDLIPAAPQGESSADILQRVLLAHSRQLDRSGSYNADLAVSEVARVCQLGMEEQKLLDAAMDKLQLSARAYHRILKLARTIADLDEHADIATRHLSEAISYRSLDRFR